MFARLTRSLPLDPTLCSARDRPGAGLRFRYYSGEMAMRSDRSEVKTKAGQYRALVGFRRASARKSALRRLSLEGLEARTLLATLPGSLLTAVPRATLPAPLVVPNSQVNVSASRGGREHALDCGR